MKTSPDWRNWKTFVLIWRTNLSFYESSTKTVAIYKMLFILYAYFYRSLWAGPELNLWVTEGFYLQFILFSTWVKITFPFNIYIKISISIFSSNSLHLVWKSLKNCKFNGIISMTGSWKQVNLFAWISASFW
jgi:hypothetical protein